MSKYVYAEAPDVKDVARRLIPLYHPHLNDPEVPVRIEYLFVDPPPESKGKVVLGKCSKITGKHAFLAGQDNGEQSPFFVIEISEKAWHLIDDAAKEALVDHELCHAGASLGKHGETKLSIIPHDVEEFACIVERHGLWEQGLADFIKAALAGQEA